MEGQITFTTDHLVLLGYISGGFFAAGVLIYNLFIRNLKLREERIFREIQSVIDDLERTNDGLDKTTNIAEHNKECIGQIKNILYAYGIESMREDMR